MAQQSFNQEPRPDGRCDWCRAHFHVRWDSVRRRLAAGEGLTEGRHDHCVMWFIVAGRGVVGFEGRDVAVSADTGFLVPAGFRMSINADVDRAVEFIRVPFDMVFNQKSNLIPSTAVDVDRMVLRIRGMPELALHSSMTALNLGQVILRARHQPHRDLAELHCQIQLLRTIYMLRQACLRPARDMPTIESKPSIRRAYVFLLEHADEAGLRLEDVARHVGLSIPHLTRRFRNEYGSSPMKVLARERLTRARRLLATPDFRISEIAHACGFRSSAYFCRAFRAELGMTPSEYRRTQPALDAAPQV